MKLIAVVALLAACDGAGGNVPAIDATPVRSDAKPAPDDAVPFAPLEVLTVNLKTPLPSDSTVNQRTALVAALILAEQPDIVALQEVTKSSSLANRAEALAGMLSGYQWKYRRTHQLVIGEEGIAILARGTITWQDDAELPHTEFAGALHRAVLGARVTVGGRSVELFATHLTVAGSAQDRADQVATALAFVRAHHQPGVPAYFAGDLNMEPPELANKVLRGEASHDGETGNLVDAWTQAMGTAPGFTIPSDDPDRRIDYIYALPASGTAKECTIVLANASNGVRASDHLGVLCRFE